MTIITTHRNKCICRKNLINKLHQIINFRCAGYSHPHKAKKTHIFSILSCLMNEMILNLIDVSQFWAQNIPPKLKWIKASRCWNVFHRHFHKWTRQKWFFQHFFSFHFNLNVYLRFSSPFFLCQPPFHNIFALISCVYKTNTSSIQASIELRLRAKGNNMEFLFTFSLFCFNENQQKLCTKIILKIRKSFLNIHSQSSVMNF